MGPAWSGVVNSHTTDYHRNTALCIASHGKNEQESPADAGIPARRKNDEKNSSISKL